jgi:hypothetical protein
MISSTASIRFASPLLSPASIAFQLARLPDLCAAFEKDYADLSYVKGAFIWHDEQTPWLILIIRDARRAILSAGPHEIVHLCDRITSGKETRQRKTMLVAMPWRRQTSATLAPGFSVSCTIARFCSSLKRRRFDRPSAASGVKRYLRRAH